MVEQAKRVRRVVVNMLSVLSSADDGDSQREVTGHFTVNGEVIQYETLLDTTIAKMIAYGTTQLVNDALAGEDDKEAALAAVIARIKSGDWSVTRAESSGLTLASVARDMIKAKVPGAKAEDVKAKVAAILADPSSPNYAKVKAELERRQSQVLDIDL